MYLIFPAIWLVCAVLSAVVASAKGRNALAWFVIGFLFGPLGLLISLGVPPAKAASAASPGTATLHRFFTPTGELVEIIRTQSGLLVARLGGDASLVEPLTDWETAQVEVTGNALRPDIIQAIYDRVVESAHKGR